MFLVKSAYANCPACIVTVAGGLLLAKKLGIDDLLVSIWISGLNTAIAFYIASRIRKKIIRNPVFWSLGFYLTTIIYLLSTKQIGHKGNVFWGIDKILFGLTVGLLVFFFSVFIDKYTRYKNHGKVLFYYQKIIIPLLLIILSTIVFKILL